MLDISLRLRKTERLSGAAMIAWATWAAFTGYGIAPLLGLALMVASTEALAQRAPLARRPELVVALSCAVSQLCVIGAITFAAGPSALITGFGAWYYKFYLLPLLIYPAARATLLFPSRVAALVALLGTGSCFGLGLAITLRYGFPPAAANAFGAVAVPMATIAGTVVLAQAVRDIDEQTRGSAIVDRLTGMLNRVALDSRVAELEHHTKTAPTPVSVIVADVDRFKQINDADGHAVGDAVLAAVAERLRAAVRRSESIYRLGGEEFALVLAGTEAGDAAQLAERLRRAISSAPISGVRLTVSFGVAGSAPGQPFVYDAISRLADNALYEAKRTGRDKVCVAAVSGVNAPPELPGYFLSERETEDERRARRIAAIELADDEPVELVTGEGSRGRRPHSDGTGNALVADATERAHLVELVARIGTAMLLIYALVTAALVTVAVMIGNWWVFALPLAGNVAFLLLDNYIDRFRRPEYVLMGGWIFAQLGSMSAFIFVHSPLPYISPILVTPIFTLMAIGFSCLLNSRVNVLGLIRMSTLLFLIALLVGGAAVDHQPSLLVFASLVLVCVSSICRSVASSALYHRTASIVDPLTGALNRAALDARISELAHQVASAGHTVTMVVADIDHFKDINDSAGHPTGDLVLREVVTRMRGHLRTFDSLYRYGGEEFVVLLTDTNDEAAHEVAERLLDSIQSRPIQGHRVTMSFGIAATAPGQSFAFRDLFTEADTALYDAKHTGRNRICHAISVTDQRIASTT